MQTFKKIAIVFSVYTINALLTDLRETKKALVISEEKLRLTNELAVYMARNIGNPELSMEEFVKTLQEKKAFIDILDSF